MGKEHYFWCSHHKVQETVGFRAVLPSYLWVIQKIQWEHHFNPVLLEYRWISECKICRGRRHICTLSILHFLCSLPGHKHWQKKKKKETNLLILIIHRNVMPPEVLAPYLMLQKWKCPCVAEIASSGCVLVGFCLIQVERKGWREKEECDWGPTCQLRRRQAQCRSSAKGKREMDEGKGREATHGAMQNVLKGFMSVKESWLVSRCQHSADQGKAC